LAKVLTNEEFFGAYAIFIFGVVAVLGSVLLFCGGIMTAGKISNSVQQTPSYTSTIQK
jgi:hypothetical protein